MCWRASWPSAIRFAELTPVCLATLVSEIQFANSIHVVWIRAILVEFDVLSGTFIFGAINHTREASPPILNCWLVRSILPEKSAPRHVRIAIQQTVRLVHQRVESLKNHWLSMIWRAPWPREILFSELCLSVWSRWLREM